MHLLIIRNFLYFNYANNILSVYQDGLDKGSITVAGRDDINLFSKFRISSTLLGLNNKYEITEYTHEFGADGGWLTKINYGEVPYDLVRSVSNLESNVYGG